MAQCLPKGRGQVLCALSDRGGLAFTVSQREVGGDLDSADNLS